MSMVISGDNGLTFPAGSTQVQAGNYQTMVNRIINGRMQIDQRNAGASVTQAATNLYGLDRWTFFGSQASKFTVQQNAGSVTPPAGFTNYLGVTSSSAYTVGASELFILRQKIEGFNVADFNLGKSSAVTFTLSFWVRSSLTGTFGGSFMNNNENRAYPFTYTISSANTWEQKSITVVGDTSGTWATDNTIGMQAIFGLGVGSSLSGTAGAWAGSAFWSATGATSVVGTNGATFYITGVDLRVGSYTVVPQDFRAYGTELALCQRYYWRITGVAGVAVASGALVSTSRAQMYLKYPTTMRAAPTISQSTMNVTNATNAQAITSFNGTGGGFDSTLIDVNINVIAGAANQGAVMYSTVTTSFVDASAEL